MDRFYRSLIIIVQVMQALFSLSKLQECPSANNCSFVEKCKIAHCRDRGYNFIPKFKDTIQEIDFSKNPLSVIPANNCLPPNLEKLDLSFCCLVSVELGAFEKLTKLEYLDISYNTELSLNALPNITNDLIRTNIKTFKFNGVQCSVGKGITLKYEHLCRLQNTTLETIEYRDNRIDMIEALTLRHLPRSLTNISAGNNIFMFGTYFLEFASLVNLRFVNLSNLYAMENPFRHPWTISCDDTRNQNARIVNGTTSCPSRVSLNQPAFNKHPRTQVIMHLPKNLETLVMENCVIQATEISDNLLLKFDSLKYLYSSRNLLTNIRSSEFNGKLEFADISNCFLSKIDMTFINSTNLIKLNVSYNYLEEQLSDDSSADLFKKQERLSNLDLSRNRLTHIAKHLFKYLKNLQYLNMSGNEIDNLDFEFRHLSNLKLLDVSHNRLKSLSEKNMEDLDHIGKSRTLNLSLSENPLLCTCDTLPFITWVDNNIHKSGNIKLENYENYTCSFANSSSAQFTDISNIRLNLDKACSSYTWISIISCVGSMIVLSLVIYGIIYRYRWKIRYFYYLIRRGYRGYVNLKSNVGIYRHLFDFDAFISYSEDDRKFAFVALKSEIEKRHPSVRLCFHQENFTPGTSIAENIVNAVHKSRKTICVVSNNYIRSEWCMYEFNIANMEKVYTRGDENVVFFLLLDSFKPDNIPATMVEFLHKNSYLEVPRCTENLSPFWDQVGDAILDE